MGVCSERRKLFTFLFFSKRETEDLSVVESFDEDRRRRYGGLCLSCLYVWLAEAVGLRREGRDFSFFPAEISYKMRTIASSKFQVLVVVLLCLLQLLIILLYRLWRVQCPNLLINLSFHFIFIVPQFLCVLKKKL